MLKPVEVAPFTGAWIETIHATSFFDNTQSPPSRGRGLKHRLRARLLSGYASPPSRGRGLKPL